MWCDRAIVDDKDNPKSNANDPPTPNIYGKDLLPNPPRHLGQQLIAVSISRNSLFAAQAVWFRVDKQLTNEQFPSANAVDTKMVVRVARQSKTFWWYMLQLTKLTGFSLWSNESIKRLICSLYALVLRTHFRLAVSLCYQLIAID